MTKPQIKKILLDLIYTPDAKPRFIFVGGNVDDKLSYIDEAVEKLFNLNSKTPIDRALEIVVIDDDFDTQDVIAELFDAAMKTEQSTLIDYLDVDGFSVWEKLEYEFSCDDFLKYVGLKE